MARGIGSGSLGLGWGLAWHFKVASWCAASLSVVLNVCSLSSGLLACSQLPYAPPESVFLISCCSHPSHCPACVSSHGCVHQSGY